MKNIELLSIKELPNGFSYPYQFERILSLGITDLEPWYIIEGVALRQSRKGLAERYPGRILVPFARRQDNDDVACWSGSDNNVVYVIHDFASSGWEQREMHKSFYDWLRKAVDDFIEFDS